VLKANSENMGAQNGNCHAVAGSNAIDNYTTIHIALTEKIQYMYIYFTIVKYTYIGVKMTEKRVLHNE
jgi:hypothetical protein